MDVFMLIQIKPYLWGVGEFDSRFIVSVFSYPLEPFLEIMLQVFMF